MTNEGQISASGASSKGIYAISVGGGGGSGGTTSSASFSFDGVCSALTSGGAYDCKPPGEDESTTVSVAVTAEIGGSGGAAGDGAQVQVINNGSITTNDDLGHGIVAHSIGGGGGDGADGALGIEAWTNNTTANSIANLPDDFTFLPDAGDVSMAIGGSGGAVGNGGSVMTGGTGTILTFGDHAFGIHAQSIGGGGGSGGAGVGGLWSQLTVGGRGSGGGTGGKVTVDQGGVISTTGVGGVAIFAQSVGGGGGAAGDIEKGFADSWLDLNIGAGTGVQLEAGVGGDGGDVSVTAGAIETTGARAHGIIAQSVGGSGGIAHISGVAGNTSINNFVGNTGDAGNGGDVTVNTNGAIEVLGESSHGIFAQSVGGTGVGDTAGDININVNQDINVTGANGRGILAQSDSTLVGANGTIAISIAKGATVSTAANGAETVGIFDGKNNTLSNAGVLRQGNTNEGSYVIRTNGVGNLTITNSGTIEGNISSATNDSATSAPIRINNSATGNLGFGNEISLGTGGSVHNSGTMYAGSRGTFDEVTINHALTQTATGTLLSSYNANTQNADLIIVNSATAPSLSGTVLPNHVGAPPKSGASGSSLIFVSEDTDIVSALTVADTATVDYSLSKSRHGGGQRIDLSYKVDFVPWAGDAQARSKVSASTLAKINTNHTSFANHFEDLVTLRQSELGNADDNLAFVDDLGNFFLSIGDVDDLVDAYDRFAPTEIVTPSETAVFSSLRFSDNFMSCPATGTDGMAVFTSEGSCFWGRIGGVASSRDAGQSSDYDENVFGLSVGYQTELATDWFAGFALGYEQSNISSDTVNGDGDRFNIGAVIKHEIGATTLAGSISAGVSDFDLDRQVLTPSGAVLAEGNPQTSWVAAHARVAHSFDLSPTTYLKPWADLGIQHLWQDSYSESGAGAFGLNVGSISSTSYSLNLMLELGTTFEFAGMPTEAAISAGGLFLMGDTNPSSSVGLIGVGLGGPTFTVTGDNQTKFATLNAEIKTQITKQTTLNASVGALISSDQQELGGSLKLAFLF